MDEKSIQLVARYRDGDQAAATAIFERYFLQLRNLLNSRISGKLSGRLEADDVAQSVMRIFFTNTANDRFILKRSGDLWRLLVGIGIRKLHHEIGRHSTAKRDYQRHQTLTLEDGVELPIEVVCREPTPVEAAAVTEAFESAFSKFDELEREIYQLRLEGESDKDIAEKVDRSPRNVRWHLERIRKLLESELRDATCESALTTGESD